MFARLLARMLIADGENPRLFRSLRLPVVRKNSKKTTTFWIHSARKTLSPPSRPKSSRLLHSHGYRPMPTQIKDARPGDLPSDRQRGIRHHHGAQLQVSDPMGGHRQGLGGYRRACTKSGSPYAECARRCPCFATPSRNRPEPTGPTRCAGPRASSGWPVTWTSSSRRD